MNLRQLSRVTAKIKDARYSTKDTKYPSRYPDPKEGTTSDIKLSETTADGWLNGDYPLVVLLNEYYDLVKEKAESWGFYEEKKPGFRSPYYWFKIEGQNDDAAPYKEKCKELAKHIWEDASKKIQGGDELELMQPVVSTATDAILFGYILNENPFITKTELNLMLKRAEERDRKKANNRAKNSNSNWLKNFIKASKDMPYYVDEDSFDPDANRVQVLIEGYYDKDPSSYKSKWLKKAAEADAQADHLNEDRWNPSWDVAEDALVEVCQKLGLVGYEDPEQEPECIYFMIGPEE